MLVPYDVLLMVFYYGTASRPNIKAQKGQKPIVERHSNAHVSDSYPNMVNDWFHLSSPPFACSNRPNRSGNHLGTSPAIAFHGVVRLTLWLFGLPISPSLHSRSS